MAEVVVRASESEEDRDGGDRHEQLSLAASRGLCVQRVVGQHERPQAAARPQKLARVFF